jgi:nitrogen regulatory protein PII
LAVTIRKVEKGIEAIIDGANSSKNGGGKIFATDFERVIHICTGEDAI